MSQILVVDDNVNLSVFVVAALTRDGFHVTSVASAEEACDFLDQNAVDVLVSDVQLPAMSGIDLLKHVRIEHPDVVVLLLSLFADAQMAREALALGAFDCLRKPTSVEMLRSTVQRAVAYKH
ncbi:MAG: response regulator [Verrucomicrobia bacterium]|nr:response regulator [Verrucomicrobiota bacterium]MDA1086172.1 response regulator [Verrucomicrobiota bacterium]